MRSFFFIYLGAMAVLMRQTNVVWVVLFFGSSAINEMFTHFKSKNNVIKKSENPELMVIFLMKLAPITS